MSVIIDSEDIEDILKLVAQISPQAKEFVNAVVDINKLTIFHYSHSEDVHGVCCMAESNNCRIVYASYAVENDLSGLEDLIEACIQSYIDKMKDKELCFNVNGRNASIITLARKLGFTVDVEGYHLVYNEADDFIELEFRLIEKAFEDSMLGEFVELFDEGYYQMNFDEGQQTDWHHRHSIEFLKQLERMDSSNIRSYWLGDQLVGAYIIDHNYVRDLVVHPNYQNHGYGSEILKRCIRNMIDKGVKRIYLRVLRSNVRAKRFYLRHHFKEIACFSEHTYRQW